MGRYAGQTGTIFGQALRHLLLQWCGLIVTIQPSLSQKEQPSGWVELPTDRQAKGTAPAPGTLGRSEQPGSKPGGILLKGQVEHTERLEPTVPTLSPGTDFREGSLPAVRQASEWYRIPEWFAGTFEVEDSTVVKSYDYRSGQTTFLNQRIPSQGQETRGFQRDALGKIWQYSTTSGTSKSEQAAHITYNIIHWYGPEEIHEGRVVMRVLATSVVVNKQSAKIVAVYRREDIKTYVPLKPGVLSVSYTSKSFTADGSPQDLQTGFAVHKLISRFKTIDRVGDTDLAALFRDYLVASKMGDLVPDRLKGLTP